MDEKMLLENILKDSKALSLEELTKALGWSPKQKKTNRQKLEAYVEEGILFKNKKNKYNLPENLGFIKGTFSAVKPNFAFVDTATEGIFVHKSKFNGALNGDTVLIKLTVEGNKTKKKEGEVVKILTRNQKVIVGTLERSQGFGFVKPSHPFGQDVFIPFENLKGARSGELVAVEILDFGGEGKKPKGLITDILGNPDDSENMIEALILRSGIPKDFSVEALREARDLQSDLDKVDEKRHDLRDKYLITIDGSDAKDLDDAVYLEKNTDGTFKLYVAIADVSYYVKQGCKLDEEAKSRGNSVYLVNQVIPMFPREISNDLCSLNPNEDKFVFVCEMYFDKEATLISSDVYKGVISSKYRMTYSDVNEILAGDKLLCEKYQDILPMLNEMEELSLLIRDKKYKRGSIEFEIPEIKVTLGKDKKAVSIDLRERGESQKIIEDFMVAANEAVAEKLFWLEVPSLYRIHDIPDTERLESLNEVLSKFKFRIPLSDKLHPKMFQQIIEDSAEQGINLIVHKMILRTLKQACYSTENKGHFGLASTHYTHFTSPIRRYADLMVHRILNETLKGYPSDKFIKKLNKELDEVATHISKTERTAMKAEQESVKIKVVEYMLDKIGEVYKGRITGFNNKKIFIETEENIECFWDVGSTNRDFEFNEKTYEMIDRGDGTIYTMGQELEIMIARVDLHELIIEVVPSGEGGLFSKYLK